MEFINRLQTRSNLILLNVKVFKSTALCQSPLFATLLNSMKRFDEQTIQMLTEWEDCSRCHLLNLNSHTDQHVFAYFIFTVAFFDFFYISKFVGEQGRATRDAFRKSFQNFIICIFLGVEQLIR